MLATTLCRDSDPADPSVNGHFSELPHSSCMLRDGAKLEIGRDIMGHVDVGVTDNVYGESRCNEGARAVWLTPHFFAIRRKAFRASAAEPGYQ